MRKQKDSLMKTGSSGIEEAYRKKVSLLQGLLGCLRLEQESLVSMNLKSLWSLMEQKDSLLDSIGRTDQEIRAAEAQVSDRDSDTGSERGEGEADLPKEVRAAVRGLSREVRHLKMEIRARVKENVSFIQETLRFFDEIVFLFAAGNRTEPSYEARPRRSRVSSSLIYEREV
jgi:flagellar biosynthesis/type III secretory pathway chaperone